MIQAQHQNSPCGQPDRRLGDFSGSAMQADSINPNVLQYTLEPPLTDSSGNTYNYAVTETARGEPTG